MFTQETKEAIVKANEIALSDRMQEIINKYATDSHYPKSQHVHNIVTGSAVKLLNDIHDGGGTEKEIDLAIEYLAVCIQSHKYHINIKKYGKENGIWDLRKKYQPWRIVKAEERRIENLDKTAENIEAPAKDEEIPEIE